VLQSRGCVGSQIRLVACLSIGQTSNQPDLTAYTATALQHI